LPPSGWIASEYGNSLILASLITPDVARELAPALLKVASLVERQGGES
jgi:hypothetical protein